MGVNPISYARKQYSPHTEIALQGHRVNFWDYVCRCKEMIVVWRGCWTVMASLDRAYAKFGLRPVAYLKIFIFGANTVKLDYYRTRYESDHMSIHYRGTQCKQTPLSSMVEQDREYANNGMMLSQYSQDVF